MKNPWNVEMAVEFEKSHAEELMRYFNEVTSVPKHARKKQLLLCECAESSKEYLRSKYWDEEYGIKVLCREIGLSYSNFRTLMIDYLKIPIRKGTNVVTNRLVKFRSERVQGDKNPFYDWTEKYPQLHKSTRCGLQGYYQKKDGSKVWLRSSWEFIFAKWLDKNNIVWEYEGKQYKLSDGTSYRPDFSVVKEDGKLQILEVKGFKKDRLYKVDLMRSEFPEIEMIVIDDIVPYCSQKYSKEIAEWNLLRQER